MRRSLNLDVFVGFAMAKLRFPRGSFWTQIGRLQKALAVCPCNTSINCYGVGMDALVTVCSWNTNVIMVCAAKPLIKH